MADEQELDSAEVEIRAEQRTANLWDALTGGIPTDAERYQLIVNWALRMACVWCFVGHGAWGIITKAGWLKFFAVFHIPEAVAWKLMPLVGGFDIAMGLVILFRPCRIVLAWMAFWGLFTAFLRPMAGLSYYEVLERAGNFGPPLVYYLWATVSRRNYGWFARIGTLQLNDRKAQQYSTLLLIFTSMFLIGHGGFGAHLVKQRLVGHWELVALAPAVITATNIVRLVGAFQIALGVVVLLAPTQGLMTFVIGWKVFNELLYPMAGQGIFEFVERGGDYFAPMAWIYLDHWRRVTGYGRRLPDLTA